MGNLISGTDVTWFLKGYIICYDEENKEATVKADGKNTQQLGYYDLETGKSRVLTVFGTNGIAKMSAGETSVLILTSGYLSGELFVYHMDSGVMEQVSVDNSLMMAFAGGDTYWINWKDADGVYCFQEYAADTGQFSEKYKSNFTYELTELTYAKETGLLYGRMYSLQYLCFNPRKPQNVSRFTAQEIYQSPACFQSAGGRIYVQDKERGKIYHFDPSAFVNQNKPLKGYVTSEFAITEWAGYNIDLRVISWEELALKVLAEDRDYDFVVMTTDMAEATAIREAMAYLPIPEDVIKSYWAECWSCVREGATHQDDTSSLTYAEQYDAVLKQQAAKVYFEETGSYSTSDFMKYIGVEGISVCKVPGMSGTEETVQVSGTFLILNPNSENKEELFEFVSAMSEIYIANLETYLSANAERYPEDIVVQDVCELYRNGEMVFGIPEDLFDSYYYYVTGADLNPDEVVKELNRVVNMYYGE